MILFVAVDQKNPAAFFCRLQNERSQVGCLRLGIGADNQYGRGFFHIGQCGARGAIAPVRQQAANRGAGVQTHRSVQIRGLQNRTAEPGQQNLFFIGAFHRTHDAHRIGAVTLLHALQALGGKGDRLRP
ncbi:MAG: hypothetical protein BWY83_02272 [bacterium ADurb.Bin478]|nr:MAG: hypothetical protein BWY83_02272 [bacterium ADurb.Bin478]